MVLNQWAGGPVTVQQTSFPPYIPLLHHQPQAIGWPKYTAHTCRLSRRVLKPRRQRRDPYRHAVTLRIPDGAYSEYTADVCSPKGNGQACLFLVGRHG